LSIICYKEGKGQLQSRWAYNQGQENFNSWLHLSLLLGLLVLFLHVWCIPTSSVCGHVTICYNMLEFLTWYYSPSIRPLWLEQRSKQDIVDTLHVSRIPVQSRLKVFLLEEAESCLRFYGACRHLHYFHFGKAGYWTAAMAVVGWDKYR
jgi:hypothetical protein